MEKIKKLWSYKFFRILSRVFLIIIILYFILVGFRIYHFYDLDRTNKQVDIIHNTKLKISDVMGDNLPNDPGAEADKTVVGIDANQNGIRDDVELAVFKEYPNSAKNRTVLLQYALALQKEFNQKFLNTEITVAVAQEVGRSYVCIGDILTRNDSDKTIMDKYFRDADLLTEFVDRLHVNTRIRSEYQKKFYEYIGSYNSLEHYCDIDYSTLPN